MGSKKDTAKGEADDAAELAQAAIETVKDKLSDPARKDS